jgi:hypothetical protein
MSDGCLSRGDSPSLHEPSLKDCSAAVMAHKRELVPRQANEREVDERGQAVEGKAKTLKRRVANAFLWAMVQAWGGRLASFVIVIVLGGLLGPEAYRGADLREP